MDIGANVGLFSLMAFDKIKDSGEIFSFEPINKTFKVLEENIKINNIKNIKSFNIGLNLVKGYQYFSDEDVSAHISEKIKTDNKIFCDTLDNLIYKKNKFHIAKIDTEGAELNILKGGINSIQNDQLPILILEVNKSKESFGISNEDIEHFLLSNGYIFGEYTHFNKTLNLNNKFHEDTIAVSKKYLDKLKLKNKSLVIKQMELNPTITNSL